MCHEHIIGGHFGIRRVTKFTQADYFWPKMEKDLRDWGLRCNRCLQVKSHPGEGKMKLNKTLTLIRFERVAVDIAPGSP